MMNSKARARDLVSRSRSVLRAQGYDLIHTAESFNQFGRSQDAWGVVDVIHPASWAVTASIPLGGTPGNISIARGFALVGAGDADSCDLFIYRTDTNEVWADASKPFFLLSAASGWCTVGKIAVSLSEEWAYVPVGVWGAEAFLLECQVSDQPIFQRIFDLAPGANLPSAVGLVY